MTTSTDNPAVAQIRQHVRSSVDELNQLIEGPLASLDATKLYQAPTPGEWTIMENLAHIIEVMPYWGDEIAKLVASPGQSFGRTHEHEGRLRAIRQHRSDSLDQIRADLPGSYAHLDQVLQSLRDCDLELTGHHSKFGDRDLAWFIKEFVTDHLANHVEQIKACLQVVAQ
ncbi:MAG TPA: DinB family protein [Ktedonobacteraceae bacterium]|nr:DinB family protein [Ktedonobacteraceae bacterium]